MQFYNYTEEINPSFYFLDASGKLSCINITSN